METAVRWKHKTVDLNAGLVDHPALSHEYFLDKEGKDGWELASVDNGIAYFKRPVDNHAELIKALENRSSLV